MQNVFSKPIGGIPYIQCFMVIILDILLVDYGIRLDHKLIGFDWRYVNDFFFKKIVFRKNICVEKSKTLYDNCKGNSIMLIFVFYKVKQCFARNMKLRTRIADLRCDDVIFG